MAPGRDRWTLHAWRDGRWTLTLDACAEDIRTVRLAATEVQLHADQRRS